MTLKEERKELKRIDASFNQMYQDAYYQHGKHDIVDVIDSTTYSWVEENLTYDDMRLLIDYAMRSINYFPDEPEDCQLIEQEVKGL